MKRTITYTINPEDAGCTIHDFLCRCGFSSGVRTALKKTSHGILRNDIWAYTSDRLDPGDTLTLTIEETLSSEQILPVNLSFELLYEDEDLLIVNKPADMPVHPSLHNYENTLANALSYYYKEKGEAFVFRCINRLDRQTTGVTVIAKNPFSSCLLYQAAAAHQIQRTYLAVVSGTLTGSGTIRAPIAREDGSAITRQVSYEHGVPAVTHYEAVCTKNGHTLVRLSLETGRTHQIRVHMKYIGFPLIGDYLYHPDFSHIDRVALHSAAIAFAHPLTKKEVYFEAPLPKDMASVMGLLSS